MPQLKKKELVDIESMTQVFDQVQMNSKLKDDRSKAPDLKKELIGLTLNYENEQDKFKK